MEFILGNDKLFLYCKKCDKICLNITSSEFVDKHRECVDFTIQLLLYYNELMEAKKFTQKELEDLYKEIMVRNL